MRKGGSYFFGVIVVVMTDVTAAAKLSMNLTAVFTELVATVPARSRLDCAAEPTVFRLDCATEPAALRLD